MSHKEWIETLITGNPSGGLVTREVLVETIRENHEHHLSYDDTGTYPGSDLCNMNTDALGLPRLEPTGA